MDQNEEAKVPGRTANTASSVATSQILVSKVGWDVARRLKRHRDTSRRPFPCVQKFVA
jgi:hypothetical protein